MQIQPIYIKSKNKAELGLAINNFELTVITLELPAQTKNISNQNRLLALSNAHRYRQ